jgi:hypothetical protein
MKHDLPEPTLRERARDEQTRPNRGYVGHHQHEQQHDPAQHSSHKHSSHEHAGHDKHAGHNRKLRHLKVNIKL